ncbi:hypothetical protein B5X24_HaOG213925 [Helicoverpa armigera]|uniref:Uncharacterized protein n=1 Tax=Helicoverpa armigera TaxID=29058 RepID=A0A2W1BHR9_HELAM|nr:hypothetical protein B5X24_HaOG213925 [Helicoverpa armigera]
MALVFRKAVLPKNVSLLKYFRGRPLATAASKKNPAALSAAVPSRSLKDKARTLRVGTVKIEKAKQLPTVSAGRSPSACERLRFCVSCPDLVPVARTRLFASPDNNAPRTRTISHSPLALLCHRSSSLPGLLPARNFHTSNAFDKTCPPPCNCGCPCPFPCGPCGCPQGCNCLPPPCNQPPKCIQYMTGYYYYPYGFWFCGPYHVSGTCTPVGPCSPAASCPCPCPCPKCCACLNPVAAMAMSSGAQQQSSPPTPRPPSRSLQSPIADIKYPLPGQDPVQCNTAMPPTPSSRAANAGISKFFPFNAVPNVEPIRRLPHTVLMCPYSTKPIPPASTPDAFQGGKPVYCTPCLKQQKNNFSNRARQNFCNNCQKTKKSLPNSLSKSYSDYHEKRTESRSPIHHHKRPRRLNYEVCPLLESPRGLMTQEQRDRPDVYPGAFQYANIPNYRSPYPTQPFTESTFKAYDV